MSEATNSKAPSGLAATLRKNPATEKLMHEATHYAKSRGLQLAGELGKRVAGTTEKLTGVADSGGQLSGFKKSASDLAEGKSPTRSALGGAATGLKEKVKSLFKRRGKGGKPKVTNIQETIDIGVPVDVAYNQWTQFQDFSRFMKGVESVELTSETEQNWRVKVFKSRRTWKGQTSEAIPDRRIAWTSEGAKGSTRGAVTFHPLADDLTRIMLSMEYYPQGFFEKTGNIWRAAGRRTRLDLKNFRRFIMIENEATGSWRGEIRDGEVVRQPESDEESGEQPEATGDEATGDEATRDEATRDEATEDGAAEDEGAEDAQGARDADGDDEGEDAGREEKGARAQAKQAGQRRLARR